MVRGSSYTQETHRRVAHNGKDGAGPMALAPSGGQAVAAEAEAALTPAAAEKRPTRNSLESLLAHWRLGTSAG